MLDICRHSKKIKGTIPKLQVLKNCLQIYIKQEEKNVAQYSFVISF